MCTGAYIYYELGVITTQVVREGSRNCVIGEIKEPVWAAAIAQNLRTEEEKDGCKGGYPAQPAVTIQN